MMKIRLYGISETLLIPLWARAVELKEARPIIKDCKAAKMVDNIDYNFEKFEKEWSTQISIAVRTEILDNAIKVFIRNHPDGIVINIGCGLDTRFSRIDNGQIRWFDLDLPDPINVRKQFFRETDRYKMIAKSVFDYSWIDEIPDKTNVLIIAEGILMYLKEKSVVELLNKLVDSFPNAEMLLEITPPSMVKQDNNENLIKKQYQIEANFRWGVKKGIDLEQINTMIKFIEEWHYFDYHRNRWKSIRWLSLIPGFKNRFGNRIVHIKFLKISDPK